MMEWLISFLVSVAANVVSNLICKWLDEERKEDNQPKND